MIDRQIITTLGGVAAGTGVIVTLSGAIYGVFETSVSPRGAGIIAALTLTVFALLVLTIDNRRKINELEGDES
jgi:hypothetical protein